MGHTSETADTNERTQGRSLDDFTELRDSALESARCWWPQIGPTAGSRTFSFTHRLARVGPITLLDLDFHDAVWVNGGDVRPHYHVTLPVPASVGAQPGSVAVFRPEAKAAVSGYVGPLLAVMIDRHAVEDALSGVLGRSVTSQIDF